MKRVISMRILRGRFHLTGEIGKRAKLKPVDSAIIC